MLIDSQHDLDMAAWAVSVQAAVTAIRNAGATSQIILLPGTGYSSAGNFVSTSGTQLSTVKNPDGSFDNLAFDVHQYLDATFAGTNAVCTQNNAGTFRNLGNWLRTNNRKAMLTETGGGGSESSCLDLMCKQLDAINEYSDVFLGWTGWAAGSFRTTYALSETPTLGSDGSYTDVALVTQCMAGKFKGARSLNVPLQVTN
jgi:endoglucanase